MPSEKKKISSPDYPILAQKLLETSGEAAPSKLPAGLYIIATPIGHLGDITLRALVTLKQADFVACEDTRVTGGLLHKYGLGKKRLLALHDHNEAALAPKLAAQIAEGAAIALVSDAGMPLISDPGYRLARACRAAGVSVTVLPGANAAITALAGSGLPSDAFHFAGFLPAKSMARKKAIAALKPIPGTLILHEAPQRLGDALADLAEGLGSGRDAAVAREITKLFEETRTGTLGELAKFYGANDVKGEIVILVAAAGDEAAQEFDIDELLMEALRHESVRDAAASVSDLMGARKKDVYARALLLARAKK